MRRSTKLNIINMLQKMKSELLGALTFMLVELVVMYCIDRFVFDVRAWYVYVTLFVALYIPFALAIYFKYKPSSKKHE